MNRAVQCRRCFKSTFFQRMRMFISWSRIDNSLLSATTSCWQPKSFQSRLLNYLDPQTPRVSSLQVLKESGTTKARKSSCAPSACGMWSECARLYARASLPRDSNRHIVERRDNKSKNEAWQSEESIQKNPYKKQNWTLDFSESLIDVWFIY